MKALLPDFAWYMVYQSGEELSYTGSSEGVSFVEEYAEETSSMFSVYLRGEFSDNLKGRLEMYFFKHNFSSTRVT